MYSTELESDVFNCKCIQLRQLEERLLDTISAVEGTILDDDTVVQALEDLKAEAGDVAKEVSHSYASRAFVHDR